MNAEQSPFAYAAAKKALSLRDKATLQEQAFIDAIQVRYVKDFDPKTRVEQDKAYAEAMQKVFEKYPDDLDAGTLYGDALFLLEPRVARAMSTRQTSSASTQCSVATRDPKHPGPAISMSTRPSPPRGPTRLSTARSFSAR